MSRVNARTACLMAAEWAQRTGVTPWLDPETAHIDGTGWNHDTLLVSDTAGRRWVFRFPRHDAAAAGLAAELAVLPLIRNRLPVPVPEPAVVGTMPETGYLFTGYPYVDGVPCTADALLEPRGALLVQQLGLLLAILHTTPVDDAVAAGVPEFSPGGWREHHAELLGRLTRTLSVPDAALAPLRQALDDDDLWPMRLGLVHGDLEPAHLLVDTEDNRISGVIDWADARIADPAVDFAELVTALGPEAYEMVLGSYARALRRPLDPGFRERVRFHVALRPVHTALHGLEAGEQRYVDLGLTALEALG